MKSAGIKPRVVFDCNVLVQAIGSPTGPGARCLRMLDQNLINVFVSRAVLREFRLVMQYPSVRQKFPNLKDEHISEFVAHLLFRATLVREVPHVFDYPRAQQDEPYIDLAAAAGADLLVSRDDDLLSLATDHSVVAKEFRQRFTGLRVMTPVRFLEECDRE